MTNPTPDEKLEMMKKDTSIYFHDDSIRYMLSRIVEGKDTNCDGIGRLIRQVCQQAEYKCDKCGKIFITEGE